ncbi:2,3-bisphosphoglycerate-independent phosphoglycerate mutase [Apibacter adventoris]|uniref:2,3-bisphosphoglycerate-independent phosphoglycerate mutase n=1 Tax=Apibacter adventoris TaxID=1679466 RepID=UPI000CF5E02A|nr:2,3-bisphosphoglycerate-independent phosphoglycerate mutase [Apibacter adventoris]PQL95713.1 2,3-bisphosphoglycerate-independent phosphoglycerate mutase [Apibacter adventoris]
MNKKVILMILDGWGIATDKKVSAIDQAKTPFIDSCFQKYSNTTLITYGLDVGLPKGQMGNSEVGHMNLGAGRVVYQNLAKINLAVENGTLGNEEELKKAFEYAKKNNKSVHFIGLVSDGGVHSHISHLKSLVEAANTSQVKNIFVHAFTDGRDCDPQSGKGFIKETLQFCNKNNAKLASIVGRYYAMDRDKRWERVKIAYDTIVNAEGIKTSDPLNAIQKSYEDGITDEFLMPIIVTENDKPIATIQEGDVVICFNFRTDRPREIVEVLTQNDYPEQSMKKLDLYFVTMTEYDENFKNIRVIFKEDTIKNTLGEVIANATKKQIRIAETEKYPHVTFFFSGGKEEEFKNESRILCPSPKDVPTYDLKPQMAAYDIKNAIIPELKKKEVDFVCLNFANADMVGHTGVFEAAVKACEAVDECAKEICQTALENGYVTVIIADHGNSDKMKNEDGSPNTQHTTNLVPMIIVDNQQYKLHQGKLGDIAPTILTLMGIPIPKEMTGDVLI